MEFIKDLLIKQRYPALLLLAGLLILFAGSYSLSGKITEPQVQPQQRTRIFISAFGCLLVLGSALLFLLDEDFVAYRRGCKISNTKNGFSAKFRDSTLTVNFGLLQEIYDPSDEKSAVILPANEFFDDRCFGDDRTAAGALVGKYFSAQGATDLRELVHRKLSEEGYSASPISPGSTRCSYGIGTCVYIGKPLGQPVQMIFAAIASDRLPDGLKVDLSSVFKVVEEIRCNLASQRLSIAFMPLLGAGKGGVPAEIALMTLLSALLEARCKDGGHHLKNLHIVVFQAPNAEPQISPRRAKRALRQMISLYQDMLR